MTPVKRPLCPPFLKENGKKWAAEYAAKRYENPTYQFRWKTWQGVPVNQRLMGPLSEMTDHRCAHCDWYPMDSDTVPTIDHFKPKAEYPKEAYTWSNLYLACPQCQRKDICNLSESELEQILRPDDPSYTFEHFFIYKHLTGDIEPNPAATLADRQRAEMTLAAFKLNSAGRPAARKRMLAHLMLLEEPQRAEFLKDQPFRYLL